MRSAAEWAVHDQGRAVASEPLAHRSTGNSAQFKDWSVTRERPLKGLFYAWQADLTRVLAGPVATRFSPHLAPMY